MDGTDSLIGTAILAAAIILFVVLTRPRKKENAGTPRQPTRWRRLRVHASGLYREGPSSVVQCEAPGDVELSTISGSIERLPILLGVPPHKTLVKIERPRISRQATLKLRVKNTSWLKLKHPGADRIPDLVGPANGLPPGFPAAEDLEVVGDLEEREYEIRADGRLVASVSWQRDEQGSPASTGQRYTVEITKSAAQLPIVALVLALEVATSLQGSPIELRETDETT